MTVTSNNSFLELTLGRSDPIRIKIRLKFPVPNSTVKPIGLYIHRTVIDIMRQIQLSLVLTSGANLLYMLYDLYLAHKDFLLCAAAPFIVLHCYTFMHYITQLP